MRVYVSSTTLDLEEYRRAVIGAILRSGHTPVCMEHHAAADVAPLEECLREVAGCDVYVGIFAWRYGYIPAGADKSITELEYRKAVESHIPALVFLDEEADWPAEFRDAGLEGERIRVLRRELRMTRWVGFFSSPENLATEVLAAISVIVNEKMKEHFREARETSSADEQLKQAALRKAQEEQTRLSAERRRQDRTRVPIPIPEKLTRHFQDRHAELDELRQCLLNENLRMVLIYGRGGVGKTTLAEKLIRDLIEDLDQQAPDSTGVDSVLYVSLREPEYRTPERIVELLRRTLHADAAEAVKDVWTQGGIPLRDRLALLFQGPLARRRCLIVMDNFEAVLDDDNHIREEFSGLRQFVDAFVEYEHAGLLIATSQRVLALSPEAELAAIGRRVHIALDEGLPELFAIRLLREFDCDNRRPLGIKGASDEVLAGVVRRCERIPRTLETLVITLLQHPTWTLDTLLANEALLSRLAENPARELYMGLSSDEERLVMQALAVLDKPAPSAAIRFVLPALPIDEILDRLVRNSVASFDRDRFWLHPLDRQYAYSQIPDTGADYSKQAFHGLAAEFYLSLPCPPTGHRTSVDDVTPMLDAFEHLLAADRAEDAANLLFDTGLNADLYWWGNYLILVDLCKRLLGRPISADKEIILHTQLGKVQKNLGKLEEARAIYQQALPLVDCAADPRSAIGLLVALGDIGFYLRDIDGALKYHQRAQEMLAATPDPTLQSESTGLLANLTWAKHDYPEALRLFEEAIAFSQAAGNRIYEGIWNGGVANVHSALYSLCGESGHRERAVSHYIQAIALARETKDRRHESHWQGVLGQLYQRLGELDLAEAHLREALTISAKIHYERVRDDQTQGLITVFSNRIDRKIQRRDFPAVYQACRAFARVSEELGVAELQAAARHQIDTLPLYEVAILFEEGRTDAALEKGRSFLNLPLGAGERSKLLGDVCSDIGRQTGREDVFQLAVEAYTRAISAARGKSLAGLYEGRANACALMGKIEEAITDYSEAVRRDPEKTGAALSCAELHVWAGRYREAREALEGLRPKLGTAMQKIVGAWLMCHALNLEGQDFSSDYALLAKLAKRYAKVSYGVKDIEPYLRRLDPTKFSERQIQNAWKIQSLVTGEATPASKN